MLTGIIVGIVICAAFAAGLFLGWELRDRNAYDRGEVAQGSLVQKPLKDPFAVEDFASVPEEDRLRE